MDDETPNAPVDTSTRDLVIGVLLGVVLVFIGITAYSRITSDDNGSSKPAEPADPAQVAAANAANKVRLQQTFDTTNDDDPEWSDVTEARLAQAIADSSTIGEYRNLDVGCAARLCRVAANVPNGSLDLAAADAFLVSVTQAAPEALPNSIAWTERVDDNSLDYLIWLARDGHAELLSN